MNMDTPDEGLYIALHIFHINFEQIRRCARGLFSIEYRECKVKCIEKNVEKIKNRCLVGGNRTCTERAREREQWIEALHASIDRDTCTHLQISTFSF